MKQKGRTIQLQQGTVADLISQIANLPEREKSADDPISLPEIFRTKEYITEIRGALKRGYTFEDLSKIFTERCGVSISTRQLKYNYTRGKNKPQKGRAPSPMLPQSRKHGDDKGSAVPIKPAMKGVFSDAEVSPAKDRTMDSEAAKSGSFVINMALEDI